MMNWRQSMAMALVFGSVHLLMADGARAAQMGGDNNEEAAARGQVQELGPGAEVKLKLKGGETLKGEIGEVGPERFALDREGGRSRMVEYGQVSEVRLAKLSYKATGHPDAAAVRRVVRALGAGKHVAVKTAGGTTYRGHLRQIGDDEFTLLSDRATKETRIAYSDVTQVGKNLTAGATIAVLAGVLAAVLIVAMVLNKDETPKVQI